MAFASPSYRPHRLLASLPTATRLRRNYFTAYRSNYEEVVTAPAPRLAAGTAAGTAAITTTIPRNAPHFDIASARRLPSRRRERRALTVPFSTSIPTQTSIDAKHNPKKEETVGAIGLDRI